MEELTSLSQEMQSIHVAVVADLSQLLSRSSEGLVALLLHDRELLKHLMNHLSF